MSQPMRLMRLAPSRLENYHHGTGHKDANAHEPYHVRAPPFTIHRSARIQPCRRPLCFPALSPPSLLALSFFSQQRHTPRSRSSPPARLPAVPAPTTPVWGAFCAARCPPSASPTPRLLAVPCAKFASTPRASRWGPAPRALPAMVAADRPRVPAFLVAAAGLRLP